MKQIRWSVFFLAEICKFHQKLAMKYVSRYFCNVGIEGWKIAGWQESQNNIDILEPQNYYMYYYSISLEFGDVLTI